jgi:urease accessory protein
VSKLLRLMPLGLIALATPALAHPGHDRSVSFATGLLHPLTGADHLLTMLMVGLWAGLAFPRHWWICPAAFVAFMLGGFAYGVTGGPLPIAEMLITASLVGLGLALVFDARPPLALSATAVALFAIAHGFVHGHEMAQRSSHIAFASGFLCTTILLHSAGLGLAQLAKRSHPQRIARLVGAAAAVTAATTLWST